MTPRVRRQTFHRRSDHGRHRPGRSVFSAAPPDDGAALHCLRDDISCVGGRRSLVDRSREAAAQGSVTRSGLSRGLGEAIEGVGMAAIVRQRMMARIDGDFCVFLIGMRVNQWLKIHHWWPVAMAMPRMIKELYANPQT